jgi:hypothetical protein
MPRCQLGTADRRSCSAYAYCARYVEFFGLWNFAAMGGCILRFAFCVLRAAFCVLRAACCAKPLIPASSAGVACDLIVVLTIRAARSALVKLIIQAARSGIQKLAFQTERSAHRELFIVFSGSADGTTNLRRRRFVSASETCGTERRGSGQRFAYLDFVRPNVRAKRATAAGRQARAGENVPRTTGPGLVACRWRSA